MRSAQLSGTPISASDFGIPISSRISSIRSMKAESVCSEICITSAIRLIFCSWPRRLNLNTTGNTIALVKPC